MNSKDTAARRLAVVLVWAVALAVMLVWAAPGFVIGVVLYVIGGFDPMTVVFAPLTAATEVSDRITGGGGWNF